MKKILLSVALLVASISLNAQVTTTLFENNFDDSLGNLSLFDYDGDGDVAKAWIGVPPFFTAPASGGCYRFDGRLESGGAYKGTNTFDVNSMETKDAVAIPAGGSAELSFDVVSYARGGVANTAIVYITIYDNNTDYNFIAGYEYTISTADGVKHAVISIPEGLGNSYVYEIAQIDQTKVLAEIFIDNLKITHTTALSTNDFISSKFSVSPNPANDLIKIKNADNMFVSKVTVTDLNGRTVKNVSFDNVRNSYDVTVADLASGLYIMNITSDKGTATKKFVKN